MGRRYFTCCDHSQVKRGSWNAEEDLLLKSYVQNYGHENWRTLPRQAGLQRCGKSCRLRWTNYLRPGVKRGDFTPEDEATIIKLHASLGNKWSKIASKLPGRTDNEIKNVWNTRLKKTLPSYTMKKRSVTMSASNSVMLRGASEEAKDPTSASSLISYNSNDTNNNTSVEQVINNADHEVNIQEEVELPSESDYEFWNMIYTLTQFESTDEVQSPLVEGAINSSTQKNNNNEEIVGAETRATGMDYNHEFAATHDSSPDVLITDEDQHGREKGNFFFKSWSSSPFS